MKNLLHISYTVLIVLFAVSVGAFLFGSKSDQQWVKDLSLNVGTEIMGILLTVFLIDTVIRRNEAKKRARAKALAFQQLRIPLLHQISVLQGLYKASVTNLPEKLPVELEELFGPSYFVQIAFLDFSKPAPLASTTPLQWFDYLKLEAEKFRLSLSRTIEKYAVFLEVNEIELLEELINSSFLSMIEQATAIRAVDIKESYKGTYNLFGGQGMDSLVKEYTAWFTQLVAIHNSVSPDNRLSVMADLWRKDFAPQVGSARIT